MHVDSKAPSMDYEDFLDGETRYAALKRTFPENAKTLFSEAGRESRERYRDYKQQETLRSIGAEET